MLRAFIIIRIYNNSITISVIKHTGEDKDNNPFLYPVFPYHTVHLQMCLTFPGSNTLCLTNSQIVSSLVCPFILVLLLLLLFFGGGSGGGIGSFFFFFFFFFLNLSCMQTYDFTFFSFFLFFFLFLLVVSHWSSSLVRL